MNGQHIVVIGAGYAGITAATGAGRRCRVTLIAPEALFAQRIRQHETAAGHREHRPALAALIRGRSVTHRQARVGEIDLAGRKVLLEDGEAIGYDTLVYALGSSTAWRGVPGAAESAYGVERAAELRGRVRGAERPGTVAVVGGGATGIELAAELAEAYPAWQVRLVAAGRVGGWFSAKGRSHVLRELRRLGVQIQEEAEVTEVTRQGLLTARGPVEAEVVVWAAAMEPSPLAAQAGLGVADDGRALVDDRLRSLSHPEVHVVGDAASATVAGTGTLRMGCATALPMGRYVGKLLSGRTSEPFAYRYTLQCLSLGRRSGLVQLVRGDDAMRPTAYRGLTGRLVKAVILRGVAASLR
ncbi:FAD-dependent oxidoreductase [Kitasatospora nipponensis]|uniref:FAD-dependent oxidoreductase n=1 Tax=Kitasatospora nipponensis TaxID=258049 RepID=A0ABP4G7K7_9ACTN